MANTLEAAGAVGVAPGFLLMPAREYAWELKERVEIKLPLQGSIKDLMSNVIGTGGVEVGGEDQFSIFEDGVLQLWEVVRILFVEAKYPSLADDECLNVVALELKGEDVVLYGEIIKSV